MSRPEALVTLATTQNVASPQAHCTPPLAPEPNNLAPGRSLPDPSLECRGYSHGTQRESPPPQLQSVNRWVRPGRKERFHRESFEKRREGSERGGVGGWLPC